MPSIAGAIKRHFRDNGWSVRVPRDLQELALRVERVSDELVSETGHAPTAAQIADRAGIEVEDVLEAREAFRALHSDSLDQPRGARDDEDAGSLLDTLGDADLELGRATTGRRCTRCSTRSTSATARSSASTTRTS